MRVYIHIIFPIFITASIYSLVSFFFGAKGIYAQRQLEQEMNNVAKNIKSIKQKGVELDILIKNLTSDEETIKIFAHDLGYVSENEGIIKLTSFKPDVLGDVKYGSVVKIRKSAFISDTLCKKFACLMGLISFIIEMLILKSYDRKEREQRVYSYS